MTISILAITLVMATSILLALGQLWGAQSPYQVACALLTPALAAAILWLVLAGGHWALWVVVALGAAPVVASWRGERP